MFGHTVIRTKENAANLVGSSGICKQDVLTIPVSPTLITGHSLVSNVEEVETILELHTTPHHLGHLELSVDVPDNLMGRLTVVELVVKYHHLLSHIFILHSFLTKFSATLTFTFKHEVV